ncbi:hypothetical protein V6N13_071212 [Hibiscus sabdariffa]
MVGELSLDLIQRIHGGVTIMVGHGQNIVCNFDMATHSSMYQNRKASNYKTSYKADGTSEQRLSRDGWPEYYDSKAGRYVGKQARKSQTWSISGYLVATRQADDREPSQPPDNLP